MIPVKAFNDAIANLIAGDVTWLAALSANMLYLVVAPFTPSPALVVGDVDIPDTPFSGGNPIAITPGTQQVVRDMTSGAQGIYLLEPDGGIRWVCTDPPSSPVVVYGVAMTTNDKSLLIATDLLLEGPVTIQFAGDYIELTARFGFLPVIPCQ